MNEKDEKYLRLAIEKSLESVAKNGFPAGAIVVKDDEVVGSGISISNALHDPTSHGEMASIRQACSSLSTTNLSGSTLYASMQPCLMCFGAALWSGISRIVFACSMEQVAQDYYGGNYRLSDINGTLLQPLHLDHFSTLENDALLVVREWEKQNF